MSKQSSEEAKSAQPKPLYAKLQPRWCGLSREEVARHQRARIYGAMIEAVAERGYDGASIKYVSALAGVSRQTFYNEFGAREQCFLMTYDLIVGRAFKRITAAQRSECDSDWETLLRRAFAEYAAEAVEYPKAAQLALVEVFCAGPIGLARMDRTRQMFERMISFSFDQAPDGAKPSPVVIKGIACGVERITRWLLVKGRIEELPDLADELLAWVLCYRSPAAADLPLSLSSGGPFARCQRRVGGAPVGAERMRILRAAAEIAASEGYSGLTSGAVVDRARISYATFEESWKSTEECFLDALDLLGLEAMMAAGDASLSVEYRLEGIHTGLARLMDHVAGDETLRRVAFVEVFAVGRAGIMRREQLLQGFVELLSSSLPWAGEPSQLQAQAIVGAIWGIVHYHVRHADSGLLPSLVDQAAYLALAPAIGAEAAVEGILACGEADPDRDQDTGQVGNILNV